ncbi:hypothetical protein D3C71_1379980 [compost metagenome]
MRASIIQAFDFNGGVFALGNEGVVEVHHLFGWAVFNDEAALQQESAVAQALNGAAVVRNDE